MKPIYIYVLVDPLDGMVKYVGQTTYPEARFSQHMSGARAKTRPRNKKSAWIYDLSQVGQAPLMCWIGKTKDLDKAIEMETDMIQFYLETGHPLLNHDGVKTRKIKRPIIDEDRLTSRLVKCWECGNMVPKSQCEWDGFAWYCGC